MWPHETDFVATYIFATNGPIAAQSFIIMEMKRTQQSLYQLYLRRSPGRWEWFCDLLTPAHHAVLAKARAALQEEPEAARYPLRLEYVQDFPKSTGGAEAG